MKKTLPDLAYLFHFLADSFLFNVSFQPANTLTLQSGHWGTWCIFWSYSLIRSEFVVYRCHELCGSLEQFAQPMAHLFRGLSPEADPGDPSDRSDPWAGWTTPWTWSPSMWRLGDPWNLLTGWKHGLVKLENNGVVWLSSCMLFSFSVNQAPGTWGGSYSVHVKH